MIKKVFACLLACTVSTVFADDTITIYQLDGSIHCQTAEITTLAESEQTLRNAGVKVFSSSSRSVPFEMSDKCGAPTGNANVLLVDAGDWQKMLKKRRDAHGFGVWIFDRPTVEVYKYDGSLQCGRGKEIGLEDMAKEFTTNGIKVKASRKGSDALMHIAICGASTGKLNVYRIATNALPKARELGFSLLITRKMAKQIKSPESVRRASPQARAQPRGQSAAGEQIPRLW